MVYYYYLFGAFTSVKNLSTSSTTGFTSPIMGERINNRDPQCEKDTWCESPNTA